MSLYILVFIICLTLDRVTKSMANRKLPLLRPVQVYKAFYLVLTHNKGAVYGFMKKRSGLLRFLSAIAMLFMIGLFAYAYINGYPRGFMISFSVVMAGAFGNFSERITKGQVTDFLYIRWRKLPVFNLADLFILFGMIFVYRYGLF